MKMRSAVALLAVAAASDGAAGQEAARPTVETLVLEALGDADWQVRAAAASLLGVFGIADHARSLQPLLEDAQPEVWKAAWRAHSTLRPGAEFERAAERIAAGRTWSDVELLVRLVEPVVRAEHAEVLREAFGRAASPHAQYGLMVLLAKTGAEFAEPALAWAAESRTPAQIQNCSVLLPLIPGTRDNRQLIQEWLDHDSRVVRHRSAAWLQRHGGSGPRIDEQLIPDYVELTEYAAETAAGERSLGADWVATTKETVVKTAAAAPLVLVADLHGSAAIKDLLLQCVRGVLTDTAHDKVAFGYETPVKRFLAAALDGVQALGVASVALEPEPTAPSLRTRDASIDAAVQAWLGKSREHKMVALYGHNHVLGRGHLHAAGAVRILTFRPANGLLQHLRADSLASGVLAAEADRWFVLRGRPDTFFVICDDATWSHPTRRNLEAWFKVRLSK